MIGIIDYNAGNIKSVSVSLLHLGIKHIISNKPTELKNCNALIFPGVGEAGFAMKQLKKTGFDSFIKDSVEEGKRLLGICLGSQILFQYSEEGDTTCLGLLKGSVQHFNSLCNQMQIVPPRKIPHIGWNNIKIKNGGSPLLFSSQDKDFYFVHSYVIQAEDANIIKATCDYKIEVPSCVEKGNITAFQFHPEKSGEAGLEILRRFATFL